MPRRMSCSMTVAAVRDRTKTVTRRHVDTWRTLKPGDRLTLIEKGMGLPKGARQVVLADVEIVDVRIEPIGAVTAGEAAREGFSHMPAAEFVAFWLVGHGYSVFVGDDVHTRRRATMWDVPRFAEQNRYAAVVVENVVEATKWVMWPAWWQAMELLGYTGRIVSANSMHHGVPQSRDRIYVVWTRDGLDVDLEQERPAFCGRCDRVGTMRQAWKKGRRVGRYRQQWVWSCTTCGTPGEPATVAAATIIDWALDCPRIGDRARPLADATRARILAGLQRYGWAPVTTTGAGNVHERTPGNRARPVTDPLPTQQTTATSALATPPGFLVPPHGGGRRRPARSLSEPYPTVCASDDRQALVVPPPSATTCAFPGGRCVYDECWTAGRCLAQQGDALIVTNRSHHTPVHVDEPLTTLCAGGNHHGLLMRNNGGGAEMVTPVDEPARTMTTAGHQSLLVPYTRTASAQPVDRPAPTQTTRDRLGLVDVEQVVDDCGFRMLEPYEVAAAMAFPAHYIPRDLAKKDQVKLAGNAVTPPVMQWIVGRIIQALEVAS